MIEARRSHIAAIDLENKLKAEDLDITLPGKRPSLGARHPVSVVYEELERIFAHLGFEVLEGPDVELDYNNFEALNVPKNHPSRDIQDTFYITDESVLRTHTTCVDIRIMKTVNRQSEPLSPVRFTGLMHLTRRTCLYFISWTGLWLRRE